MNGFANENLSKKSIPGVGFALTGLRNGGNDVKCNFPYEIGDFLDFFGRLALKSQF